MYCWEGLKNLCGCVSSMKIKKVLQKLAKPKPNLEVIKKHYIILFDVKGGRKSDFFNRKK